MAAAFFSIALASRSSRFSFRSFASSSSRGLPFPGKAFVPSVLAPLPFAYTLRDFLAFAVKISHSGHRVHSGLARADCFPYATLITEL
jgi:hypothetical protein